MFYYKFDNWRNSPSKKELEQQEKQRKLDDIVYKKRQLEYERKLKEKEKEEAKERRKRDFWFKLGGRETEEEIKKVFEKLGFKTELIPPSNDEGGDLYLDGKIPVQIKNQKRKTLMSLSLDF